MQIKKALINKLCIFKISWKLRISDIYNVAVRDLLFSVILWETQCAMRFMLRLQRWLHARGDFFYVFMKSEGTCACILLFLFLFALSYRFEALSIFIWLDMVCTPSPLSTNFKKSGGLTGSQFLEGVAVFT